MSAHILVVEDEPINLDILVENLQAEGYRTTSATCGEEAWRLIQQTPNAFDVILLDRIMPDIDGIEILRRLRSNAGPSDAPVIMQTAMTADADVAAGLRAGAYYYLTKPFSAVTLLAIVAAAIKDYRLRLDLQRDVRETSHAMHCLNQAKFKFNTPDEARKLATLLAQTAPDPSRAVLGLTELMLNAIEHGNLGITYAEKSLLIGADRLQTEIALRLAMPAYAERRVTVEFERNVEAVSYLIRDEGKGFQWREFLDISPDRAFDTHGRGIAMSRMLSFDRMEYRANGNEVVAAIDTLPG